MYLNRLYQHARLRPDGLAVVDNGEAISWRQFTSAIDGLRNQLMRAPLPSDGVIVNITGKHYHDWVLLLALRSLGRTTISGMAWEVIAGLELADIAALVCFSDQGSAITAFRTAHPGCPVIVIPRDMLRTASGNPVPPTLPYGPFGDHIVYTSGTTGDYKKLRLPGDKLVARLEQRLPGTGLSRFEERLFEPTTVYYNHGFGPWTAAGCYMPLFVWYFGGAVIFEQRPDWTHHFFDYPVTTAFLVGPLLDELGNSTAAKPAGFPRTAILGGGGFIDSGFIRKVSERLGFDVFIGFGGTEFGIALDSLVRGEDDSIWLDPLPGRCVEVVDEHDRPLPAGQDGNLRIELAVGDPDSYLDDPEATARHYHDGFFYPGDMAVRRADGRIRILGRVDDVLNLGGRKVAVQPFERAARDLLGAKDLCAFVRQDDNGKDVLVFVIEGSELPDRALLEKLAQKVRDVPTVRFALVGAFPRGGNGMMKVNRRKLFELLHAPAPRPSAAGSAPDAPRPGPPQA